jgi:hypothetical protein
VTVAQNVPIECRFENIGAKPKGTSAADFAKPVRTVSWPHFLSLFILPEVHYFQLVFQLKCGQQ